MTEATPRITASYLEAFMNRNVRVLGKVTDLRGDTATVEAGGMITVLLNRDAHLQKGHFFDIIGKVTNDLKLRMLMSTDFGTNIDTQAAEAVVDATHRYPELFFDKN